MYDIKTALVQRIVFAGLRRAGGLPLEQVVSFWSQTWDSEPTSKYVMLSEKN